MHIHFVSLGCDKNLVDSEIMLGIINDEGYTITDVAEEAHVIIINTCGFIADANAEGVDTILEMAEYKTTGACKAIVVTGCMAQRYKDTIFDELPEIDAIVGVGDFHAIATVIKEAAAGGRVQLVTDNATLDESYNLKRMISTPSYFSYLKIAEGCDNRCTYCTIPSIRGKYRSRTMDSLVAEATMLARQGVKELVLVAQDTALYGTDLYGENRLHVLMRALSEVEGIAWIRLMYAYPEHLTDDTIAEMATNPTICHYIDMPIQHADDGVLARMGRRGTRAELVAVIAKLRQHMPDIAIRTTLIVGFPGESEDAFQIVYDFVTQMKFDKLGVFEYSREEGTPASTMPNQLTKKVKQQRRARIMSAQKAIAKAKSDAHVGKTFQVIVDGKLPDEDVFCGRTFMDAYDIDGLVFFPHQGDMVSGAFVNVTITQGSGYDLIGVEAE